MIRKNRGGLMKLLAIDTSGHALSAAIVVNGLIHGSFGADTGKNHSLQLLPLLIDLLRQKSLALADLKFSFTLLR